MDFVFRRTYRGPLKAAILDWAGTAVDYGCCAPAAVFIKVFERQGVGITPEQARGPMGLMKKDHIRAISEMDAVAARWQEVHRRRCTESDVEAMFQDFVPRQMACLKDYADPIPGALDAVARFRARGLQIGSTTGYTRPMMEILTVEAKKRGYAPDAWVCATDVPAGRPYPWMAFQNAIALQVYPLEACVKIGDTLPDIEEGLNAGMWTIGVARTGNEIGLTEAEVAALPAEVLRSKLDRAYERMRQAGAHYVADGLADCDPILDDISARLARGERP